MIINHRYRFIFLKTHKTASTSIEIALSEFCDAGDIVTSISPDENKLRQDLGFCGPVNYEAPLSDYSPKDLMVLRKKGKRKSRFRGHMPAAELLPMIDRGIWDSYFKFCFERNPFDKAISRYYFSTQSPRPPIDDFIATAPERYLSSWPVYTLDGRVAVQFVGRYTYLQRDLATVAEYLGFPRPLTLPQTKTQFRLNRDPYATVLGSQSRDRIEAVCTQELAAFNYDWNCPQGPHEPWWGEQHKPRSQP